MNVLCRYCVIARDDMVAKCGAIMDSMPPELLFVRPLTLPWRPRSCAGHAVSRIVDALRRSATGSYALASHCDADDRADDPPCHQGA